MTPDPKAPLPPLYVGNCITVSYDTYPGLGEFFVQLRNDNNSDEVVARIYGADPNEVSDRAKAICNAANNSAHISAQTEKISALEKKLSEQIREDEMRLINHCVKIVGNNSKAHIHAEAEFLTRIAELEAENKRLREALEELARLGGPHGGYGNSIGNQIAQAALAQTGEK